jgi:DNA-binding GntR family transcriptional regulator
MTKRKKRAATLVKLATEKDLDQLRESTKKMYEAHRSADEDDFPLERMHEYWRNRYFARTAWEHAENATFAGLVEDQKRKLPGVVAGNAKLARDVETTANALAMLDLVSASLSVLAEAVTILGRVIPRSRDIHTREGLSGPSRKER